MVCYFSVVLHCGSPPSHGFVSAWTRYVGLPVSRPRDRFLHGYWDRKLAHNSVYDVAKTLELVLRL
jgi:hypothetical protein